MPAIPTTGPPTTNPTVTVPAAVIQAAALVVAVTGIVLGLWNPWHLTSDAAKAIIALGFVLIGATIFTVHVVLAAVHEYGFTKAALTDAESVELAGLKTIWPDLQSTWTAARPALEQLPHIASVVSAVTADVATVKAKVDAIPLDQMAAVTAAIQAFGGVPVIPVAPVDPAAIVVPVEGVPSTAAAPAGFAV